MSANITQEFPSPKHTVGYVIFQDKQSVCICVSSWEVDLRLEPASSGHWRNCTFLPLGIEKTGKRSKGTSTVSYIKQNTLFSFFVYALAKDSFSFFEVWNSEALYQHLIKQPPEDVS